MPQPTKNPSDLEELNAQLWACEKHARDLAEENAVLFKQRDSLLEIWTSFEAGVLKQDDFFDAIQGLVSECKRQHPDYQNE